MEKVTVGSRWRWGSVVHVVKAVTSDGEVGYRAEGRPPTANGDGLLGEWPDHWCKEAVFLTEHTPVIEAPPPPVVVPLVVVPCFSS